MGEQIARRYERQVGRWWFDSTRGHDGRGNAGARNPAPPVSIGRGQMFNRLKAVLAFGLVLLAPALVPGTAQAAGQGAGDVIAVRASGVIDCTPNGISWTDWKYVGPNNSGAGKICGPEGVCCANVRTLDNSSDG